MVYFLFISLSTVRMTASLSIFTGLVAGVEFAVLGLYYLRKPLDHNQLVDTILAVIRSR